MVNTPFIFAKLWAIISKWFSKQMLSKFQILGSDPKEYIPILLTHIDPINLPTFLGGTCTCSHISGGCCPNFKSISDMKQVQLNQEEPFEVLIQVPKEGFLSISNFISNTPTKNITSNPSTPPKSNSESHLPSPTNFSNDSEEAILKWKFKSGKPVMFEVKHLDETGTETM